MASGTSASGGMAHNITDRSEGGAGDVGLVTGTAFWLTAGMKPR